jgi:hypothetical protein
MQSAFTVLLGPLSTAAIVILSKLYSSSTGQTHFPHLRRHFLHFSSLFSIAIAIACIVRAKHGATFFEIPFLQDLLTMQFLGFLAAGISILVDVEGENNSPMDTFKRPTGMLAVLYLLLELSLFSAFMGRFIVSASMLKATTDLFHACPSYNGLDPKFTMTINTHALSMFIQVLSDLNEWLPVIVVGLMVAVAGILLVVALTFWQVGVAASLGLMGGLLYYAVDMERKRKAMHAVGGESFNQVQWGPGSIAALVFWALFFAYCLAFLLVSANMRAPIPVQLEWKF